MPDFLEGQLNWTVTVDTGDLELAALPFVVKLVWPIPENLQWSLDGNDVILTWDSVTEVNVDGYIVQRDSDVIGYVEFDTTFTDENVPEGTYEYDVRGFQYVPLAQFFIPAVFSGVPTVVEVDTKNNVSSEWNLPSGRVSQVLTSPDRRWVAFTYSDGGGNRRLRMFDRDTQDFDFTWPDFDGVELRSVAFTPDSKKMFLGAWGTDGFFVLDMDTKSIETSGWPSLSHITYVLVEGDRCFMSSTLETSPLIQVLDLVSKTMETGWPSDLGIGRELTWIDIEKTRLLIGLFESPVNYAVLDIDTKTFETDWPQVTNRDAWGAFAFPEYGKIFVGLAGSPHRAVIDIVTKVAESSDWPSLFDNAMGFAAIDGGLVVVGVMEDAYQVWDVATKNVDFGWPIVSNAWRTLEFRI